MTYATTFSGIAGWEVGLRDCGWFLQWQCEFDPKLKRFLAERFGVPVHGDIRTAPQANLEQVDVLIGSPPCQPFSTAGKRSGTGDERHLYPSFIATVGALKPRWVLMEQVPAILSPERDKSGRLTGSAPIGAYIGGLAALGYLGCYHCIPACAVGAPHRRDRIWILAHAGHDARCPESIQQRDLSAQESFGMCEGRLEADPNGSRQSQPQRREQERREWASDLRENDANSECIGRLSIGRRASPSSQNLSELGGISCHDRSRRQEQEAEGVSNALSFGSQGSTSEQRIRNGELPRKFEGVSGDQGWQDHWTIEPNVGRVAHGVPSRVDRLKGLGNAVVPLIPKIIGQAINEVESTSQE